MSLHLPTMFAMLVLASLSMAFAIAFMAWNRHHSMMAWAGGLLLQGVAYVLFALREIIPAFVSIIPGNMAFAAAAALVAIALTRFQERPVPRWLLPVPVALITLNCVMLLDHYAARSVINSLILGLQYGYVIVLIVRGRRFAPGRGQIIVALAAGLATVTMFYRAVALGLGIDAASAITDPTGSAVMTYFMSLISTLLISVGVLMMAAERAERALRESEARHRHLVESANEGICVIQGGALRFVNPKFEELSGYTRRELLGKPILPFIHEEDRKRVIDIHQRRLAGDADDVRHATRLHTRHRGVRWYEVSGVAIEWQGEPATLNFFTDITERRQMDERIRDLAYHDTLTHLPNRRLFLDHLQLAMASNQRSKKHSAVVFMDLDNFKPLNDEHGHNVGDLLLIEVAARLRRTIRSFDTAARFGGDEFVVLLNDLSENPEQARDQARQVAGKIIEALAEPYALKAEHEGIVMDVEHRCTASAGITVFSASHIEPEALIDQSDAAMYQAKQQGRNRACFYSGTGVPGARTEAPQASA